MSDPRAPDIPGQNIAIMAESLYLANLLLLPGLSFALLLWLLYKHRHGPKLAACHLWQTASATVWAGILLVLINGVIILAGGYDSPWVWVIVGLYFTTCHATLVLFGILGLAKAMAGKMYRYPLIGVRFYGWND